jgi:hypothetical protein
LKILFLYRLPYLLYAPTGAERGQLITEKEFVWLKINALILLYPIKPTRNLGNKNVKSVANRGERLLEIWTAEESRGVGARGKKEIGLIYAYSLRSQRIQYS